jgi:hypothetical protein
VAPGAISRMYSQPYFSYSELKNVARELPAFLSRFSRLVVAWTAQLDSARRQERGDRLSGDLLDMYNQPPKPVCRSG